MMAQRAYEEAQATGKDSPRFFVFDLDDTLGAYLDEDSGGEFAHLYVENGGNIYPYPAMTWAEIGGAVRVVENLAQRGDWIVWDTISRLYDRAQQQFAASMGTTVEDLIAAKIDKMGINRAGFGAFEPSEWNAIGRMHDAFFDHLITQTRANILALAHVREQVEKRAKREGKFLYDSFGLEPVTAPRVSKVMETSILLYSWLVVRKDERGGRVGSSIARREMAIAKDRGKAYGVRVPYDTDLYETLKEIRKTGQRPRNATDEEAEEDTGQEVGAFNENEEPEDIENLPTVTRKRR